MELPPEGVDALVAPPVTQTIFRRPPDADSGAPPEPRRRGRPPGSKTRLREVRDSAQTCRQAPPTRSPAAFLTLRGGVFHFRRRLSKRLAGRTPTNELRRSLGTTSLAEAVKRAGALIAALERFEAFVMSDTVVTPLQSAEAKALIDEIYRSEIAAMAARESQGGPRTIEAADAERARLQSEILALREALKRRDASCARPALDAAAASLSMTVTDATVRLTERPALGALVETREAECAVEDGATVEEATRDMRARRFGGRAVEALRPPVMLSKAIAAAEARAVSRDMVNKVRTTGECLRAHFGDVPLERLADRSERVAFLLWLERLPRLHGKAHGRNRHNASGAAPDKLREIATADAADAAIRAEIDSRKGLSLGEKRAALARALKPRLNDEAIAKHHARIKAIFDAAREDLGWTGADFVSVLPEYRRRST